MKTVSRAHSLFVLMALMLVPGVAFAAPPPAAGSVPAPAASAASVSVTYQDPHQFTESRSAFGNHYNHGDYLGHLKTYLIRKATPMLDAGQHLAITITDIQLAGSYEPWHGPQWNRVRFMRDVYPPRIDLEFTLTGTEGDIIREGSRKLRGLGYLHDSPARPGDTDLLRYDKALLDKWLRRGPAKW